MENPKPPEIAGQERTPLDVVCRMLLEQIVTVEIPKDKLPRYQAAGSASGFEVKQIATTGERYPHHHDNIDSQSEERLEIRTVKKVT